MIRTQIKNITSYTLSGLALVLTLFSIYPIISMQRDDDLQNKRIEFDKYILMGDNVVQDIRSLLKVDPTFDVNYISQNLEGSGGTPLLAAIYWNNSLTVKVLLRHGAQCQQEDHLQMAVNRNYTAILLMLLAHGARPEGVTIHNKMMIKAVKSRLKETLPKLSLQALTGTLTQPKLSVKARLKNLLSKEHRETSQAKINEKGEMHMTALHWAAAQGQSDALMLLLEHQAEVGAQDEDGNTPLHLAARNGKLNAVKILLAQRALAHLVNQHGDSPVSLAQKYHRADIVELFSEGQASRTVFSSISKLGSSGGFAWQPKGAVEPLPFDVAKKIAQFVLALGLP